MGSSKCSTVSCDERREAANTAAPRTQICNIWLEAMRGEDLCSSSGLS